jgi:GcrA cell cycle regulator
MQTDWPPEHSQWLRECVAAGMPYSRIADAINAKFNTAYSRSAAIGRARRMALVESGRVPDLPKRSRQVQAPQLRSISRSASSGARLLMPIFESEEMPQLRCVELDPRHLSLLELERGDCRYPYGGDAEGEAVTFCGHPRRRGSSYCTPHFHLTLGPTAEPERAAGERRRHHRRDAIANEAAAAPAMESRIGARAARAAADPFDPPTAAAQYSATK